MKPAKVKFYFCSEFVSVQKYLCYLESFLLSKFYDMSSETDDDGTDVTIYPMWGPPEIVLEVSFPEP